MKSQEPGCHEVQLGIDNPSDVLESISEGIRTLLSERARRSEYVAHGIGQVALHTIETHPTSQWYFNGDMSVGGQDTPEELPKGWRVITGYLKVDGPYIGPNLYPAYPMEITYINAFSPPRYSLYTMSAFWWEDPITHTKKLRNYGYRSPKPVDNG